MRNFKFLAVAALSAALAAIAVSSIAGAATTVNDSDLDGSAGRRRVVRVVERAITDAVVDVGPAGDSLGDVLAFGNPIFDADNAEEIGRDQGYCIRTNIGLAWECNWTVILDRGSITVEGPFNDDLSDSQLAITGGTGAYRAARGEMTLHARNAAGTEFDFVYHLVLGDDD